jgi:hypothetical protein
LLWASSAAAEIAAASRPGGVAAPTIINSFELPGI